MQIDLKNNIDAVESIAPDNLVASINGAGVDLQNFHSAMVVFHGNDGDFTTGDEAYTPKLQDSPDNSVWTDVAAADLDGSFSDLRTTEVQRVGYKGMERWIRGVLTLAGTTPIIDAAALIIRANPRKAPVA
ncbi:MAG: hypothetical protein IIA70_04130 [Proteobacteria bacterium]|nr:hypothetical protein [Pseudomonadota bacterium]